MGKGWRSWGGLITPSSRGEKARLPEEIIDALRDPAWQPEALKPELPDFAGAYWQSAHGFGEIAPGEIWPAPPVAGPHLGQALRRTFKFIGQHDLHPRDYDPGFNFEAEN
jgi:hypothetical protein